MKDCFSLRFNCQKSGLDVPDKSDILAPLFSESKENIDEYLKQYDSINNAAFSEISKSSDIGKLREKYRGKKLLFVGDSITSDRLSYQKIISLALPGQVFDRAVSGSFSINVLAQIDKYLDEVKPDYISILIGSNDSVFFDKYKGNTAATLGEYERNLNLIIDKTEKHSAKVILNSIPPVYAEKFNEENMYWSADRQNNDLFNDTLLKIANQRKVVYNHFRGVFDCDNLSEMFEPDGIHPSPLAHKKMAAELIKTLLRI